MESGHSGREKGNLQLILGAVEVAHAHLAEIARVILVQVGAMMMLEKSERRRAEARAVNGVLDLQRDPDHQDVYDASQRVRGLPKRGHGAFWS